MSDTKYIFDAVKKNEENVPLNFQITFTEELVPVVSEMARDRAKQGWEVKTLRETLLPWDLNES